MSETGGSRPDVSKLVWNTGPGAKTRTEPGTGQKQAGYDPGPPGEIPTAENWNWLLAHPFDVIRWMDAAHIREFADLNEAIAATSAPQVFRIGQPSAGNRYPGEQVYSITPGSFTTLDDAASDGEQAYYFDGAANLLAARNPDDGSSVWSVAVGNSGSQIVAADGLKCYTVGNNIASGCVFINRTTGAETGRAGTPQSANDIAANGQYCVIASANPANTLYYYTAAGATPTETGNTGHGNPVGACDVDRNAVYWGGVRGGGVDVRCNFLASRAGNWTSVINGTAAPIIGNKCIKTDGERVYVGTTRTALGAGFANFYVLEAATGTVITTADVQVGASTDPIVNLAIDGRYVYCTLGGATANLVVVRVEGTAVINLGQYTTIAEVYDADGIGVIATDGAGKVERYYFQDDPTTFQATVSNDAERRPWHKLALPIRGTR